MYKAIVSKISVSPHPNADRLAVGNVRGYQVVVGIDTKDGDLGVYFPTDGQLSQEYCDANDLIRRKNPETGANEGGMFDANRRVRSQSFRGVKSEGYFAPLSSFSFLGDVNLSEGDLITEINGVQICNKYETPATVRARSRTARTKKTVLTFPKHPETEQLRFCIDKIQEGALITLIEKKHGTSARMGYVRIERKLSFLDRLFKRDKFKYEYIHGTRNVVLQENATDTFYSDKFRVTVFEKLKPFLKKDELLYGEIVGFTESGQPIMPEVDTSKLKDKDFEKAFGKKMTFRYGCSPNECEFWLYRVARINEDGELVELSWNQVKNRAKELGLRCGPEFDQFIYDGDKESLLARVNSLVEGASLIDPSHIREGVVIQVEDGETRWYKHKSYTFGVLEGYIKESNVADREEAS